MEPYIITISRQFGSLGRSVGQTLSENLQIPFYDRDIVETAAKRMGMSVATVSDQEEQGNSQFFKRQYPLGIGVSSLKDEIFNVQSNIIKDLAQAGSCIFVGRCSHFLLKAHERILNVYIYAPYDKRLHNCMEVLKMSKKDASKMIHAVDRAREVYRKQYCKGQEALTDAFDLMIDSSRFGVAGTARTIQNCIEHNFS